MLRSTASRALSWSQLASCKAASAFTPPEATSGPTNSQSTLRLFGQPEASVRATLYRDNHAWCPYCQKVWLWLEEKEVPYRIEKVTMFCYGDKEAWYKKIVPSGMLPAIKLDKKLVTESDVILATLEEAFGPLGAPFSSITPQRKLERTLFRAWCEWLCYPSETKHEEELGAANFGNVLSLFEKELGAQPGPWLLGGDAPSTADLVFVPYVERMSASLYYYKGYTMRDATKRPNLCRWFDALEARPTYRGTQSDFHTHAHDLPPQMGGCFANGEPPQQACAGRVDAGPWAALPDTALPEPPTAVGEAISRACKHKDAIIAANPCAPPHVVDEALRCALTRLATGDAAPPPEAAGAATALLYVRDRINVPRDMSLHAARRLRAALNETAADAGPSAAGAPPAIPTNHRRDQDPRAFCRVAAAH